MSRFISRVNRCAFGVLAAGLVSGVAIAGAQTLPTTSDGGVPATSTDCGSGTITQCAIQKTFKCQLTIKVGFNPATYMLELQYSESCIPSGERPIYKDKYPAYTPGGCTGIGSRKDEPSEEFCE